MAKGLLGGMTDYDHQSFNDIISDLKSEHREVIAFIEVIEKNISLLEKNEYWTNQVSEDFIDIVEYSLKYYKTAKEELNNIASEIQIEVREHHCKRLQRLSNVADKINRDIGLIWHRKYNPKDYGNKNFRTVARIYGDTRDMAVNLLDMSNIAARLEDFIGKTVIKTKASQKLGNISNTKFGDNTTIIVGDDNEVKSLQIRQGNFADLKGLLERNNVAEVDISEIKEILQSEKPNVKTKTFGERANRWILKMVEKSLNGSWAVGVGAAGKLLADAIKAYYGW